MSNNALHTEENFWPCVSDMFLALFVIALALYAAMSNESGKGEERFAELAAKEANLLLNDLRLPQYTREDQEEDDANTKSRRNRPRLAGRLMALLENEQIHACISSSGNYARARLQCGSSDYKSVLARLCNKTDSDPRELKVNVDFSYGVDNDYREVVALLTRALDLESIPINDPAYDRRVEAIREALVARMGIEPDESPDMRIAKLTTEKNKLEAKIAELEAKIAELEKEIETLCSESVKKEIEELLARVKELESENQKLKEEIKRLLPDTDEGSSHSTFEDKRRKVMDNVLQYTKAQGLKEGKDFTIEREEGVLRIPSTSVAFASGDHRRFVDKWGNRDTKAIEKLEKIGKLLVAIALANDQAGDLHDTISNIVIEAHADIDNLSYEKQRLYPGGNEELSSQRALTVWTIVNRDDQLAKYGNLFSHAGFGCRVTLDRLENESEQEWKTRCRRVDIRFICTPDMDK